MHRFRRLRHVRRLQTLALRVFRWRFEAAFESAPSYGLMGVVDDEGDDARALG